MRKIPKELEVRNPQVARAAKILGGVKQLAEGLGISRAAIYQWDTDDVPPKRAVEIERLTKRKVRRDQLCPGVYADGAA